jgi:hypothetical protein
MIKVILISVFTYPNTPKGSRKKNKNHTKFRNEYGMEVLMAKTKETLTFTAIDKPK